MRQLAYLLTIACSLVIFSGCRSQASSPTLKKCSETGCLCEGKECDCGCTPEECKCEENGHCHCTHHHH